jgi:hypothetical protein
MTIDSHLKFPIFSIVSVPTKEKDISMSETIESTPRTFTEQEIFGDDAPTTTPDAVSGPLISVARENKQGTKHMRMEVQQKLAALEHYRSTGKKMSHAALGTWMKEQFNLKSAPDRSTISKMLRSESVDRIKRFEGTTNPFLLSKKSLKETTFSELEDKLFSWFCQKERDHGVFNGDIIQDKALDLAAEMGLTQFKASPHWLEGFNRDGKVLYASNKHSWMTSTEFVTWITYFNSEMKKLKKTGWLLMDNCSSHRKAFSNREPCRWEGNNLFFEGFKLSNTNCVFLPAKTTSWTQLLDQGIICAFKAAYRKRHVRWIIAMLDSGKFENASQAKVDLRSALEWVHTAWEELSEKTVRNCWNHAKILPTPMDNADVDDNVVSESAGLLLEFVGAELEVNDVVGDRTVTEQWTEAPAEFESS